MRLRRGVLTGIGAALTLAGALGCTPGERSPGSGGSPDVPDASGSAAPQRYPDGDPLRARTEAGEVQGLQARGMRAWAGVPYAAPPVGDLRWRPPEPVEPWADLRDAAQPSPPCLQTAGGAVQGSEDCLYLNVFRPADDEAGLPVLVYIHGGGLRVGSNHFAAQQVRHLVSQGVVLVSINYRLGRMGYFAHPALEAEQKRAGEDRTANFGLLDQIAALEWVRDNIAAFGGDPGRVTIQGLSAGGASVNYLMTAEGARGLFHGAIAQSGLGGEQPRAWATALRDGEEMTARIDGDADSAADLRDLSAEDVAQGPAPFIGNQIPVRDSVLPSPVAEVFTRGEEAPVPYLSGTTDGEFRAGHYVALGLAPESLLDRLLAGRRRAAVAAYGSGAAVQRHLLDDLVFSLPARLLTREHASRAPSFRYRFSVATPADRAAEEGAPHGSDRLFPFGIGSPQVADSEDLARRMSTCFVTFVKSGAPDCGVDWPKAETGGLVEFTNDGPRVHDLDPWQDRLDLVGDLVR